ncbi:MAG TPA: DUF350 domain-containing protein [Chitinophagales bacterium]|nr:DUF350 domain-containing protein [Chitinophagales bacterium]
MEQIIHPGAIMNSIVFSLIGIVILVVSFYAIEKFTPENLYKEVIDNKNMAVAMVASAFIIAIAIIIGFAIHG